MNRSLATPSRAELSAATPAAAVLQRQCACGTHTPAGGECASCAGKRRRLQRRAAFGPEPQDAMAPPIVYDVLRRPGRPLDEATRAFFEPRFGHDFSRVRVHTDAQAAESAAAVNALAYTVGTDIVFSQGQFAPQSVNGRELLAHELSHALQQRKSRTNIREALDISEPNDAGEREAASLSSIVLNEIDNNHFEESSIKTNSIPRLLQRDLLAYSKEHTEFLPTAPESSVITYETYAADAAHIESALQALITANRVGVRRSGDRVFFFNRGASRSEIAAALSAAGYARAPEMTDALLDQHNVSIYSRERLIRMSGLFVDTTLGTRQQLLERQTERPLTDFERAEARLVFGNSLNLDQIMLAEDPILSVGGYARTTPWTINFPTGSFGSSNFMPWLIHELTHSWQYQHGVSLFTTIYHAIRANYDYGGEAGLRAAQAAGRRFTSFNTEQQGDILQDYYIRIRAGRDVAAWQPFVNEVQGITTPPAPASVPAPGIP